MIFDTRNLIIFDISNDKPSKQYNYQNKSGYFWIETFISPSAVAAIRAFTVFGGLELAPGERPNLNCTYAQTSKEKHFSPNISSDFAEKFFIFLLFQRQSNRGFQPHLFFH